MNLRENAVIAIQGLRSNKMRALLTMLGIIIGIASVIAITSVGTAITQVMNNAYASFGLTNIQISVTTKDFDSFGWDTSSPTYAEDDLISTGMVAKLKKKYGDKITAVGLSASVGIGDINQNRKKASVSITGTNSEGYTSNNITLKSGRYISDKDDESGKYVAVISEKLVNAIFPSQNPLGREIRLETNYGVKTFTVVGVFKEATDASTFVRQNTRTTFYIPVTTAKNLSGANENYTSILVTAKSGTDCIKFADDLEKYINRTFYAHNRTFECRSFSLESELSQVNTAMSSLSLAIAIIAAISLLVGGIGVMNIMLVSVTERTREIGVRKALGAPDSAIRVQFIVESMIICLIGGVFGILLGGGLGVLAGVLLKANAAPSPSGIVVAVGFSMAIGIFFGFYPANKAAKLDPIEALRYE